jgi:hypothetical protein
MEGFSRLLNYLGNVKARITSKIVWILLKKFSHLPARCGPWCDNRARFPQGAARAMVRPVSCNWTKLCALRPIE